MSPVTAGTARDLTLSAPNPPANAVRRTIDRRSKNDRIHSGEMMPNPKFRAALLVSTAITVSGLASTAAAQAEPAAQSVSALTQNSLDLQGIRSVADCRIRRPVTFPPPARTTTRSDLRLGGNAIGGASGSAPTTGVYLTTCR